MANPMKPVILSIDDDPDIRRLLEQVLGGSGYEVITAGSGKEALQLAQTLKPDLILLDIVMPEMDGYDTCLKLQEDKNTAYIPVIFLTSRDERQDKAKAFAVGAADYLTKPFKKEQLLEKIIYHLSTKNKWKELKKEMPQGQIDLGVLDYGGFKNFVADELGLSEPARIKLSAVQPDKIYNILAKEGIPPNQVATLIARYCKFKYLPIVDAESVLLGALPKPFSKNYSVVAIGEDNRIDAYVMSNPFNWELIETLKKYSKSNQLNICITEPENIEALLEYGGTTADRKISLLEEKIKIASPVTKKKVDVTEEEIEKRPVVHITNTILYTAVTERASDIHIEPKENHTVVRFRIDGDMRDMFSFNNTTGVMVITRLKALGGLDITEKRKPQDGAMEAVIDNRTFKLRLATTSTPFGESVIIRLLEPTVKQKDLRDLGMTDEQVAIMVDFASRNQGLILIVGPTGAGKTTTIYSLLAQIDCKKRSLISVEDPVEYTIPFANQQQVNEKMGVTFETLLRSSVRQDPDILFIGEVRDPYSARVAVDFASTGHVTITTLHTSNATTAIFRLERLGITRGQMADTVLGIVAQRLLKKLCPHCKSVVPITDEEKDMLRPYTGELPDVVAHPVGCPRCNDTGYFGREGIYEIIRFDPLISDMVRSNRSIAEIRALVRKSGHYLISNHAVEKVKRLIFPPEDVYYRVLVEEIDTEEKISMPVTEEVNPTPTTEEIKATQIETQKTEKAKKEEPKTKEDILLVEDDKDMQRLLSRYLSEAGYNVTVADDGVDALIQLAQRQFSLVLSDIEMPNLDGFKFMEIKNQKGMDVPVMFLTSRADQEDEIKGLQLGAVDFIKKPVKKDLLILRIKKILGQ